MLSFFYTYFITKLNKNGKELKNSYFQITKKAGFLLEKKRT